MNQPNRSVLKSKSEIMNIERDRQVYFWWIAGMLGIILVGLTATELYKYISSADLRAMFSSIALWVFGIIVFLALCATISVNGWRLKAPFLLMMFIGACMCFPAWFSLYFHFTF